MTSIGVFDLPYYDYSGGVATDQIFTPMPEGGTYTALGDNSTPWWEKILNAGVEVVGDVWGGPAPTYRYPGSNATGTTRALPMQMPAGMLVAGAAILVLLLTSKRRGK